MLVDDEPLALENVYETVPWQDYGFEVVARATNGKMALGLFERQRPHIVITDISMSPMDGLELGRRIREIGPKTRLIFLTAYRDFDYARQALDLKATHYLLKHEISRNRLLEQLLKLREDVELEQAEERQQTRGLWRALFAGKLDERSGSREADRLIPSAASLLYFELNPSLNLEGRRVSDRIEDPAVWDAVANEAVREEAGVKELLLLETEESGCAAIVQLSAPNSLLIVQYTLQKISLALQRVLQDRALKAPKIMIAATLERGNTRRQYEKIRHLYAYSFYLPERAVFLLEQALDSYEKEPAVGEACKGAPETAEAEALADWRQSLNDITASKAIDALLSAVRQTGQTLIKAGYGSLELRLGSDAGQIADALYRLVEEKAYAERQRSQYSRWVLKAMEYVRERYADPELSLETVAEQLQISAVHLRTTFRKETGQSLLDYTTEYRIEVAKRLLLKEELKIYEVSEKVGYRTSQYFSQVFKKATGLHPKDYVRREAGR